VAEGGLGEGREWQVVVTTKSPNIFFHEGTVKEGIGRKEGVGKLVGKCP
jgi:hypothetical protein